MKNFLLHNFYEPYYLYDTIHFYNKNTRSFELRKRATAISFSSNGEIVIAFHICNPNDEFNKKIAKYGQYGLADSDNYTVGLIPKIKFIIEKVKLNLDLAKSGQDMSFQNTYYFSSIDDFNNKVMFLASYATINLSSEATFLNVADINADYYFHRTYVTSKFYKFFRKLEEKNND